MEIKEGETEVRGPGHWAKKKTAGCLNQKPRAKRSGGDRLELKHHEFKNGRQHGRTI